MRLQGKISEWDDARGFGFVSPNGGGERCFVHIRAFAARDRRPATGDVVTYDVQPDAQGRRTAVAVRFAVVRGNVRRPPMPSDTAARKTGWRAPIAGVFLAAVGVLVALGRVPPWVMAVYLGMSALTLAWYAVDKSAARDSRRRTPESTLQSLALLCGWPGALVAQQVLRHKNRKVAFQQVFWIAVVINVLALGWFVRLGGRLPDL